MKIESVFKDNGDMQKKYTCRGKNISPRIKISDIPKKSKSLVLIMDDPDAPGGTFIHWVLFNIPVLNGDLELQENTTLGTMGKNGASKLGYMGPCPPSGEHRYFFKIYAIDKNLNLKEGATKTEVENAIKSHIIEESKIVGLYKKT